MHKSYHVDRQGDAWVRRARPTVTDEMKAKIAKVLAGTRLILGEEAKAFEKGVCAILQPQVPASG